MSESAYRDIILNRRSYKFMMKDYLLNAPSYGKVLNLRLVVLAKSHFPHGWIHIAINAINIIYVCGHMIIIVFIADE